MPLDQIEIPGALRLLLALSERNRYITEVLRKRSNPEGFISQTSLDECRDKMGKRGLGLIEEHMDEGPRPKTHLVITEKGRKVAELVKRIQTVLKD